MLKLEIVDDSGQRTEVPLTEGQLSIGRNDDNTIRLPERNVSRRHARIVRTNGRIVIEDVGSSWGTRVNGARVSGPTPIGPGDRVQIGDFLMQLRHDQDEPAVAEAVLAELYAQDRPLLIAMDERARLVVVSPNLAGLDFTVDRTPATLGRSEECTFQLDHRSVAPVHARIEYDGSVYRIEKVGGTLRINGDSYHSDELRSGDAIELGQVRLRYVAPGEAYVHVPADAMEPAVSAGGGLGRKIALGVTVVAGIALLVAWLRYFSEPPRPGPSPQSIAARKADPPATEGPAAGAVAPAGSEGRALQAEEPPGAAEPPVAAAEAEAPAVAAVEPREAAVPTPPPEGTPEPFAADLQAAVDAESRQEWAQALAAYDRVLSGAPDHAVARANRDRVEVEAGRKGRVDRIDQLVAEGKTLEAWEQVQSAGDAIPESSPYHAAVTERRAKIAPQVATMLLTAAKAAGQKGDNRLAARLADDVLAIVPKHPQALALRKEAAARLKAEAKTRPEPNEQAPVQPKPSEQPKASKAERDKLAQQLYSEGRNAMMSGLDGAAIEKFQAALKANGYPAAHKQLGILFAKRADNKRAIEHYKAYLQLRPDASDAEAVRIGIQRLGGSP